MPMVTTVSQNLKTLWKKWWKTKALPNSMTFPDIWIRMIASHSIMINGHYDSLDLEDMPITVDLVRYL